MPLQIRSIWFFYLSQKLPFFTMGGSMWMGVPQMPDNVQASSKNIFSVSSLPSQKKYLWRHFSKNNRGMDLTNNETKIN
ncbi:MAG: hypothetical protein IKZ46_01215 [Victivallales bacterium]|nr:hypothetical protein [Victivallales bacterium]